MSFYHGLGILLSTPGTTMSQGLVPKEFLEKEVTSQALCTWDHLRVREACLNRHPQVILLEFLTEWVWRRAWESLGSKCSELSDAGVHTLHFEIQSSSGSCN